MDIGRDSSSVILYGETPVVSDDHCDVLAESRHRLVDRIVHDFPDEVVQPSFIGRPDVHSRSFAYRLKSFEYLDIRCVIRILFPLFAHNDGG